VLLVVDILLSQGGFKRKGAQHRCNIGAILA
jgi:hypothetical protein